MSSGVQRTVRGSFTGSGAALDIRTVGFRPRAVKLTNIGALATATWQEGMADASAFKEVTAGTKSLISTQGITPLSDGFRLGTDAACNGNGNLIHYEASE